MTQTTLREYLRMTEDAISSGRVDEAMANCQNILTYFPEALEAQRLLGEVYLAQNQLEEARQTFEWILTNDPENVIVYCDRALISERTSDVDTALDCYQQAYELSRGNASIRQEFNQLSSRAGQPEFMFSRAGLARLYMRGDLLTQAIQEWEAVLALSPDRLDARLGLMETYWREGRYDKAEQVATLLLEEVPTCLKALLFQAHIASISNIPRARDLLVRAQALDPELTMAQELFSDLAASSPSDPFLALIQKEPILLENGRPVQFQGAVSQTRAQSAPMPAVQENTFGSWGPIELQQTQVISPLESPAPQVSASNGWGGNADQTPSGANWGSIPAQTPSGASWSANGAAFSAYEEPQAEAAAPWLAQLDQQALAEQLDSQAAHPAWLDSLTAAEQTRMQTPLSPFEAPTPQPPALPPVPTPEPAQPAPQASQPEEDAMPFFFPSDDESEGETSWPEWLKSLGAESLEPEQPTPSAPLPEMPLKQPSAEIPAWTPPQAQPVAEMPAWAPPQAQPSAEIPAWTPPQQYSPIQQPAQPESDPWAALPSISASNTSWTETSSQQPDWMQQISPIEIPDPQDATPDWMRQFSPAAQQNAVPDWMQQMASIESTPFQMAPPEPTPVNAQEQRYLASLEDLEKNLQSQGFVPMEPGSLAAIAQSQGQGYVSPQPQPLAQTQPDNQPSLSSALAQLGNFSQPSVPLEPTDPWWNLQNNDQQAGAATPGVPGVSGIPQTPGEAFNPFAALGARTDESASPFTALPATPAPASEALTPTYRSDALLDSDLETTMKRPAITLQPLKTGDNAPAKSGGKGRGKGDNREHKPAEIVDESNLSHHERLLRGYQYQLSGAYDESMQEYRLIIRNAPELLDDVISNLRALLKINPRFSLGYRVLGDAYMRKGEYLQAMESYNKALTMAKKAKN